MTDTSGPVTGGYAAQDSRPALVLCAYDPDAAWDLVEDLSGEQWSPPGARSLLVTPDAPDALVAALAQALAQPGSRGLLLIGVNRQDDRFRIQTRAENRQPGGRTRIEATAPGVMRATAPAADMVQALNAARLPASARSENGDDEGDYLLYRVLNALPEDTDAPMVGLLRVPAGAAEDRLAAGVKAAAAAMAQNMAPLPKRRLA